MGNLVRSADPKFLILLVLLGLSNLGVYEFYAPAACEECEQLKEQPISFDRGQLYLNLGKEIEEFRATYGGEGDATWSVVMKPFTQLIETVDGPNPGKGGFTNFKLTSQEAFSAEIKLGQMITSRRLRTSMVVGATSDEGKLAKRSMPIEVTDPYICTFGDARFDQGCYLERQRRSGSRLLPTLRIPGSGPFASKTWGPRVWFRT